MKKIIVIRGPAGVGKSSTSKLLRKKLDALLFNIDVMCAELIGGHPKESATRKKAYDLCIQLIKNSDKDYFVFERIFADRDELQVFTNSMKPLNIPIITFELTAPLEIVLDRDAKRPRPLGEATMRRLYDMITNKKYNDNPITLNTSDKDLHAVVDEIIKALKRT